MTYNIHSAHSPAVLTNAKGEYTLNGKEWIPLGRPINAEPFASMEEAEAWRMERLAGGAA